MQWIYGLIHLETNKAIIMVTFPDEIHPKFKQRIRFSYPIRALQYLEYFDIVVLSYGEEKKIEFSPLNLTFSTYQDLEKFLYEKGILQDEYDVDVFSDQISEKVTVVDASKIYEVEENINKYLLNYKYYSVNEVSEMLSLSRPTIYKIIREKKLKSIRINGQLRVKHRELLNYINEENRKI